MSQIVETPDAEFEFPDDFDQERIRQELTRHYASAPKPEATPAGMLSQEERDAVTQSGSYSPTARQAETGTTGFLGALKLGAREVGGSLLRGYDALAQASGGTDFDAMNRSLAMLQAAEDAKKQGKTLTNDEILAVGAQQQSTLSQLSKQLEAAMPVDESVKQSTLGQVAQGFGQVGGSLALAAMTGGRSAPSQVLQYATGLGQMIDETYQQAKQSALNNGFTEDQAEQEARRAGLIGGLANSAPEYLMDRTILGKFFKPFEGRGLTFGKALEEIGKTAATQFGLGGATESVQNFITNGIVKLGIDPKQEITEGTLQNFVVGGIVQGGATAAGTTLQAGATLASPENKADNLANRINQQAANMAANQDSLRLAANLPQGSTQESYKYSTNADGKNVTEAVYNQPDGRRVSVKVQSDGSPSVTPNPFLLEAPKPVTNTGEGTPVPVGTQTTQKLDRAGRQIVTEEAPVTGPVIKTPPPVQPEDLVRLDMTDITNGQEGFIEGAVLPDKSGVRITYIPPSMEGSSQQLKDASTPRGVPVKQPKVGDVVPVSVAAGDFRVYGYRPQGAWYSNMAAPRAQSEPANLQPTEEVKDPTISQVQSNRQTLKAASQIGSVAPQPKPEPATPRPYFPTAPDRSQLPREELPKKQPAFPRKQVRKNEKKIVSEGRAYFPTAPDRMQFSTRVPTMEQKGEVARQGNVLYESLRRIAPKGAAEIDLLLGQRPSNVPANTRAAYDPKAGLIYLSDQIASFPEQVGEFTHEAGHVFWDTLPSRVKLAAANLYTKEVGTRSGPLFGQNGNLRDGISPRVASADRSTDSVADWDTIGLREWFSERIMSENADWALDRANTTSIMGRAANAFRVALERIGGALGKGDAINNAFRGWATLGPRYGIDPQRAGDVAASMRDAAVSVAKRIEDEELPTTPITNAVRMAQAELAESDRKFHENFLEEVWPRVLKDVGQKTMKPTAANLEVMAFQATRDMVSFVAQNPDYAKYYDLDLKSVDAYMKQAFPEVGQKPELVKAFRLFTALTSPQTSLEQNMGEALNVFNLYLKDPNLDSIVIGRKGTGYTIKKSPFTFLGGSGPNKARSIKVMAQLINKLGADGAAEYMISTAELRQINKDNRSLGYSGGIEGPETRRTVMEATGQDKLIPRAYIFGPKVGSYIMNWLGDNRYTTIDIWESRFGRSYMPALFRRVIGKKDDGTKEYNTGLSQGSERAVTARFATAFNKEFERYTGLKLSPSALQALRWFYIIDATARAGYKGAQSNATSSEYTRRALIERGLLDQNVKDNWRQGVGGGRQPILLESFSGRVAYRGGQGQEFGGRLAANKGQYVLSETSAEEFSSIAASNKAASKFGTSVDVFSPDQYQNFDLIVASLGGETATISVSPDGEIGAVTKSPNAPSALVRVAMDAALVGRDGKGMWLSAFDTTLPSIYSSYGFQPVARMPFNDEFKPDGWDYAAYRRYNSGRPDVVFMRYASDFTKYSETKDQIPSITDYGVGTDMAKNGSVSQSVRGPISVQGRVFSQQELSAPPAGMSAPENMAVETRANSAISATLGFRYNPDTTARSVRLIRTHIDKFKDFQEFKKRLAEGGVNMAEDTDFHTIEQNSHGILGAKMESLFDNQQEIIEEVRDAGLGQPMNAIVGGQEVESTMMDLYLYAMHASERNAYILGRFGEQNGSGMSDAEAATILRAIGPKVAQARKIAERVYALNGQKLSIMEEASLISKEARQAISARYQHYVPLLGKDGATEEESTPTSRIAGGMTMVGRDITPAKGRYSAAANALAESFVAQQRALIRAERNKALLGLKRFVDAYPQNGMVEPVAELRSGETAESSNIIAYKVAGQNRYIRAMSPWVAESFSSGAARAGQVVEFIANTARLMSSLVTTYNPLFPLPNFARDSINALLNVGSTELGGSRVQYAKMLLPSLRAVFAAESPSYKRGGMPASISPQLAKMVKYYNEFKANGGQMIFMGLRDTDYYAKQVQQIASSPLADTAKVGKIINRTYSDMMEYINLGFENANRLATYALAREKGMSPQKAANLARNMTTNFTMRGSTSNAISKMFMFYQASLNGTYRVMQTLASPQGVAIASGIFAAGFLQRIISRAIDDDDEVAGVKQLESAPEYTIATNIVQPLPMSESFLKMPIPYGYNIIWYAGVKAADALPKELGGRGEDIGKAAFNVAGVAIQTLNPLGGGQQLVDSVIPSPIQPFVEIRQNVNFANQPIYPKDNPFDTTPDPYAFRHWTTTSPTLRDTMEGIARLTGGNEVRPSYFEKGLGLIGLEPLASPESVNHLLRAMFGGPYSVATDVQKTLMGISEGKVDTNALPIVRRFVGKADDRSYGMLYRDAINASALAHEEMKLAAKTGNRELAERTRTEYGPELQSYPDLSRTEFMLKKMRGHAKELEARGDKEGADRIREQVVQRQREALGRYMKRVDAGK